MADQEKLHEGDKGGIHGEHEKGGMGTPQKQQGEMGGSREKSVPGMGDTPQRSGESGSGAGH